MKILVVDDETDIQDLFLQRFRREIRKGDFQFEFALCGEDALSYLNAHDSEAILILSDINMPGMSGIELLKHIKSKFPQPPPYIMMITAYGDVETHNKALNLGANDFLNKPLDFSLLKEKLISLVDRQA